MKNYICFFVIIVFFISACYKKNSQSFQSSQIIDANISAPLVYQMSDIFDELQYIPLETSKHSEMEQISKVILGEDKIYVYQSELNQKIHVFDLSGHFLYVIDGWIDGTSDRRYYSTQNVVLDEKNDQLLLMDELYNKVIIYNTSNGQFEKEIQLENSYSFIQKLRDKYYLRVSDECPIQKNHFLHIYNESFELTDSLILNTKRSLCGYVSYGRSPFSTTFAEEEFLFTDQFSSKVYSIGSKGIQEVFQYRPEDKWAPEVLVDQMAHYDDVLERVNFLNQLKAEYVTEFNFMTTTNSSILLTHFSGIGAFWTFYNKENKTTKTYKLYPEQRGGQNNLDHGMILGRPFGSTENSLLLLMSPRHALKFYQGMNATQKRNLEKNAKSGFAQVVYKMQQDDNPVLVIAKLKETFR